MADIMYNGGVKQRGQQLADWQPALRSLDTDLSQFGSFNILHGEAASRVAK